MKRKVRRLRVVVTMLSPETVTALDAISDEELCSRSEGETASTYAEQGIDKRVAARCGRGRIEHGH